MQLLTGRCLCEGVAYEIRGELGPIFNCHCSKCRRWHDRVRFRRALHPHLSRDVSARRRTATSSAAASDHGYGIDCGVRDPFGNQLRILQPKA
jgi:hypothetical protein